MVAIAPIKVRYRDAVQTNTYHAVVVVIRVVLAWFSRKHTFSPSCLYSTALSVTHFSSFVALRR